LGATRGLPEPVVSPAASGGATACAAPEDAAAEPVRFVSAAEARALSADGAVAFIDCRPKAEFEAGHVAGSLHVDLAAETPELAPAVEHAARSAATVITYCDATLDCERSLRVASLLSQTGARDVRVLEGGLPAWLAGGYPAQSGACAECEARP
jgi:thiosulfate/3-mercaptopyruvate sulfurtransferase